MKFRTLVLFTLAALSLAAAPSVRAAVVLECPFSGLGDGIERGFYIDNYAGTSLGTVTLAHAATASGPRTISLTARLSTFDGTLIGVASATRVIGTTTTKTVFDFGDVPVAAGSRITFQQALVAGAADVSFDTGDGPCANVTETDGTTPPLSTVRRDSVGISITGDPVSIASATTLSCPVSLDGSADPITRGFYVFDYQGVTLDRVTLYHSASVAGSKTITLIARLNSFDGPLVGEATVTRDIGVNASATVFDFNDVPVPAGSTITFRQVLVTGTGEVSFDTGFGDCDGIIETFGITPPLDAELGATVAITITGAVASGVPITVVEYFHQGFGHYFMTADPAEIAALDAGAFGGVFVRTGESFRVRDGPVAGATGVCRFFSVAFAPLSSHFYTGDAEECVVVLDNPHWTFENIAFYVAQPVAGVCPGDLVPVYRLYNDGQTGAPNHRFTTNLATYDTFRTTQGWIGEGVRFCALPPA